MLIICLLYHEKNVRLVCFNLGLEDSGLPFKTKYPKQGSRQNASKSLVLGFEISKVSSFRVPKFLAKCFILCSAHLRLYSLFYAAELSGLFYLQAEVIWIRHTHRWHRLANLFGRSSRYMFCWCPTAHFQISLVLSASHGKPAMQQYLLLHRTELASHRQTIQVIENHLTVDMILYVVSY